MADRKWKEHKSKGKYSKCKQRQESRVYHLQENSIDNSIKIRCCIDRPCAARSDHILARSQKGEELTPGSLETGGFLMSVRQH